jgi:N-acetylglucosamine kinase-like BadF-type ATPase
VDGGNSKTDAVIVASDGTPLAAARGPGITGASLDAAIAILAGLVGRLRRRPARDGGPVATHLSACVANFDLPAEQDELAAALRALGWTATTRVVNDTFAVLRAGLDGDQRWGVGVTCGAGINCAGVAPDGRTSGFLALGEITGDWGGGAGLGSTALWSAMRAEDGRGPRTGLREAVPSHFGVASVRDVAVGIHLGKISPESLLELAPVLLAVAAGGDEVARALVERQAEEICTMAVVVMRRLRLTGLDTPVILGGGLLAARDPLLLAGISRGLAAAAPRSVPRVADIPPVAGAALLGLDQVGADAAAGRRLRAAYQHESASPGPRHQARPRVTSKEHPHE